MVSPAPGWKLQAPGPPGWRRGPRTTPLPWEEEHGFLVLSDNALKGERGGNPDRRDGSGSRGALEGAPWPPVGKWKAMQFNLHGTVGAYYF